MLCLLHSICIVDVMCDLFGKLIDVLQFARTAAVVMQEAWGKDNREDPMFPLHRPGTLDQTKFREALVTKGTDEAELDNATATLVSKVQTLLDKPEGSFRPERAQEVQGAALTVENADDKEYMALKLEYGEEVAAEIRRAYAEMQQYGNLVRGRNVVPWDSKKRKPLEIDQLVTILAGA